MPDGHARWEKPSLAPYLEPLTEWLRIQNNDTRNLTLVAAELLPGGAVQRNWRLDLEIDGLAQTFVLRAGPDIPLSESRGKAVEFAVLRHVHRAGVAVAAPLWLESTGSVTDREFIVSEFRPGSAERSVLFAGSDNTALLGVLATNLATVHGSGVPHGVMPEMPLDRVQTLQQWASDLNVMPPGLENSLDWLQTNAPEPGPATLVHRDFRTGNFLIENHELSALLDWEFAGAGDLHEDIGWFCAQCWRGENLSREAGGLGGREDFYNAYVAAGGVVLELARVRFWEVFAHLRWTLIAMQQGARAEAGEYPICELEEAAARVPDLMHDVMRMTRHPNGMPAGNMGRWS